MTTCSKGRQSTWVTFAGSGQGEAILDAERHGVTGGAAIAVPAGTEHNVVNTSEKEPLRTYTLVSPPEHANGTINRTRQDALADERRRHG